MERIFYKKIVIFILCFVFAFSFAACKDNSNSLNNNGYGNSQQTTVGDHKVNTERDEDNTSTSNDTEKQPIAQSVHVVRSFLAVEGAVIYEQTYDKYGYPDCCYFHKKCESCGYVSNSNGSARSNLITSYYCPKCKTTNHVEIKADSDWVEVYQ